MKVKFSSAVSFEGQDYKKGLIHELPDSLSKHWYLLALVQNGTAMIVQPPVPGAKADPTGGPKAPVKIIANSLGEKVVVPAEPHKEMKKDDEGDKNGSPSSAPDDEIKARRMAAARKAADTRARNKAKEASESQEST